MTNGHKGHGIGSRRSFLKLAGAAGATGLTTLSGCITGTDELGGGDTVKYGLLEPLTGPYSDLGEEKLQGTELAISQINESDEFDFEIEAETYDTQADTATGRRVADQAVTEHGATYLSGAISSSVALGINDFAQQNGVVYTPGAADTSITGTECNDYVFRFETNTAQIAEAMATWTLDNLGENIWFHIADYAYGDSVLEEVDQRMAAHSNNYQQVDVTRSEFGSTDFETFISQIQDSDADAVVVGMTGSDLVIFLRQAQRQGLTDDVDIMTTTASFRALREPLGSDALGVYSGVRYSPSLETGDNQAFVEAYENEYGSLPDNFSRVGYESIRMVASGIQAAADTDPETVRETLPGMEMDTIFGPNRFRECDRQAMNPTWIGELVEPSAGDTADVKIHSELSGEDAAPSCEETGCE